jgi:hypothetical protein
MILRRTSCLSPSLLVLPLLISLVGCSTLKSIAILPGPGATELTAIGQTVQFSAYGESQMGTATATASNMTTSVTWTVSDPSVAIINSKGVATAVGAGYTEVYAESSGVVATSDLTVALSSSSGSGGTSGSPAISITPAAVTDTFVGETTQFVATGSLTGSGGSQNLTNVVSWISSNAQVATINSSGLATVTGPGTTTIIAQSGGVTGTATITATIGGVSSTPTLTIIPAANITATFTGETTQFIALGNLTGGTATQNLTNSVAWSSSDVSVATIDQSGLATAVAANVGAPVTTTISAIGTSATGSLISASVLFTVSPGGGTVTLPTLAVFEAGSGTGTVTSSPGTILCGSAAAGATCTGSFQLNSTVTLTAAPATNSVFGGWSSACTPLAGNPLQCTVTMNNNKTVGAVFNP